MHASLLPDWGEKTVERVPRLFYRDSGGPGPAVVLLHSLGADSRTWFPVAQKLRGHHRLILPDTRGHGQSGWTGQTAVDDWVNDLGAILEDANIHEAHLVGVSMGGVQALAYAGTFPDNVLSVIVADSFLHLDADIARARVDSIAESVHSQGLSGYASHYVETTFVLAPIPDEAELVRDALKASTVDAVIGSAAACFTADVRANTSAITAPVRVLWGEADAKTPRFLSEAIAAATLAEIHVIPDAAHLSHMDNPEGFATKVCEFIDAKEIQA